MSLNFIQIECHCRSNVDEETNSNAVTVFINPPTNANGSNTDEDSSPDIHNLPGSMLLGSASIESEETDMNNEVERETKKKRNGKWIKK